MPLQFFQDDFLSVTIYWSVTVRQTNQICYGVILAAHHRPVGSLGSHLSPLYT